MNLNLSFKNLVKKLNLTIVLIIFFYSLFSIRFFYFIFRFTPNLLYWDQWEIVNQVINHNYLQVLLFQHNEHRIGVGLFVIKFLANLTSWNNRYETLFIGLIILISSLIALFLKKRLTGKFEVYDIVIPFIFLTLYQWQNILWGFQIAFTLPILFLLISIFLYTLKDNYLRNFSLLFLVLLSTYSSFHGVFLGFITALFFIISLVNQKNFKEKAKFLLLSLSSIILSLIYFFDYRSVEFLGQTKFSALVFLKFIILELNGYIGFFPQNTNVSDYRNLLTNLLLLIIPVITLLVLFTSFKLFKSKQLLFKNFPILALFIFSFLFACSTAYGRAGLPYESHMASRYVTFLIPLYFSLYLILLKLDLKYFKEQIVLAFLVLFIFFSSQNNYLNYQQGFLKRDTFNSWKTCYLDKKDINFCDSKTSFSVYPVGDKSVLKDGLKLLEEKKFNFFY